MPGKRVEFRPTVLVCDGSPERLHDSTPRPRQRNPANRQQPQQEPPPLNGTSGGTTPVAAPPPACTPVEQSRQGPPPASTPVQQGRQGPPGSHAPHRPADTTGPARAPTAPGLDRTASSGIASMTPVAQPVPAWLDHGTQPAVRGRGDGADDRRSYTLPSRVAGGAAAATWRPGGGGGGTLPTHHHTAGGRPRSVPEPAAAVCWPPESQSPQCFQCASGGRCFPSSSAALAASAAGQSTLPWRQRWRQPPAVPPASLRRPVSAPQAGGMSDYQYTGLDLSGGSGSERRTWVKPGRTPARVESDRLRPAVDATSEACLLNHCDSTAAVSPPVASPLRLVGWLCRSQVIAFICGLMVLLLMALALASSDWLLSDGWRQGLFAHCTEESAGRPLPFNLPFEPGCHRARHVPYIIVSEALAICCMLLDAFATLMAGLGLWSKDTNKKYQYYRAAVYVMIISLVSILIALVVYPVCFAQELEQSYQLVGRDPGNRTVWEFGWAYGVGWGAAIFLFGGVILLLCDKESEEIYYKERTIMHDERA